MIPDNIKKQLANDDFMKVCCLCQKTPVQFHHNLLTVNPDEPKPRWGQLQERFAILPLCHKHHEHANHPKVRKALDSVMLERMNEDEWVKYQMVVRRVRIQHERS
jgi:hypothetical protein